MKLLLRRIGGRVVLLWFADHAPMDETALYVKPSECSDPLFVTRQMIEEVASLAADYVEVVASAKALASGTQGMMFSDMEALAARKLMGPKAHGEAAVVLQAALRDVI